MFFRQTTKNAQEAWEEIQADFPSLLGTDKAITPLFELPVRGRIGDGPIIQDSWVILLSLYGAFELVDRDVDFLSMAIERQMALAEPYMNGTWVGDLLRLALIKYESRLDFDFY